MFFIDNDITSFIDRGLEFQANDLQDSSITEFKEALKIDPQSAETHYYLGNAFFDKELYNEALIEYRRSIEINSKSADTHQNLGQIYYNLGLFSDSIYE